MKFKTSILQKRFLPPLTIIFSLIFLASIQILWMSRLSATKTPEYEPTPQISSFFNKVGEKLFSISKSFLSLSVNDDQIDILALNLCNTSTNKWIKSPRMYIIDEKTSIQTFEIKNNKFFMSYTQPIVNSPDFLKGLKETLPGNFFLADSSESEIKILNCFTTLNSTLCFFEYSIDKKDIINEFLPEIAEETFAKSKIFMFSIADSENTIWWHTRNWTDRIFASKDYSDKVFSYNIFQNIPQVKEALNSQVLLSDLYSGEKIPEFLSPFIDLKPIYAFRDSPSLISVQTTDFFAEMNSQTFTLNLIWILIMLSFLILGTIVVFTHIIKLKEMTVKQQEFISTVTHELKTPIAVVSLTGQNMAKGIVNTPNKIARYGTQLEKEARRLKDTIEYYLLFANVNANTASRKQECDVVKLTETVANRIFTQKAEIGFKYETDLPSAPIDFECDPIAISGIIDNLIGNAIKHAKSGKYVKISLAKEKLPPKFFGFFTKASADEGIYIRVSDKGKGIPENEQKRIFEPFVRGKNASDGQIEGSGIGLGLVHRIVQMHKGKVMIEKTGSDGTTFLVILPILKK